MSAAPRLVGLLSALAVTRWEEGWEGDLIGFDLEWLPADARDAIRAAVAHVAGAAATGHDASSAVHISDALTHKRGVPPTKPRCTLPRDAPGPDRAKWLADYIAPYATLLYGAMMAGGMEEGAAQVEAAEAAAGVAEAEGWSRDVADVAYRSAMLIARGRWDKLYHDLRRAIYPMGRARAPGIQIMAVAQSVNDRHGCLLPTELLKEVARTIALGAAPHEPRPHRGR